ncbi:DUF6514 family protein [Petroclostridium sp. X23]|uniref:DUF6514 family protein n=1 Tax=Petroclostridium sp. X23 TaxID=3045146 RepID=UPI0024ADCD60|nr:DUF6514 family protein [Petroclostridium sp. X23]WHH59058.1 DUF6514 family protein [Petroclostridium sp. X23]
MYNKKLQATVSINNDGSFMLNDLKGLYLEYYILENELVDEELSYSGKSYGVEIVKKELADNDNVVMENGRVNHIYCSESKIKKLVDKLVHHTVTPIGLNNVIEDLVEII